MKTAIITTDRKYQVILVPTKRKGIYRVSYGEEAAC